ncbi:diacylglycerol diphosphate phosphatase / phosphatidate phosphatase [Pancytospora epiphaga]|nr:diacylglycerol diphosphate phosphatase / phosphatidate phosphatase [Pancytospora epiphaga]
MYRNIWLLIGVTLPLIILTRCYPTRQTQPTVGDPKHMRPYKKNTIGFALMILSIISFHFIFLCGFLKFRRMSINASKMLSMGMVGALLLSVSLTENIKKVVGRPRPDFFDRLKVDADGKYLRNGHTIEEARKSFPSGHTSSAFCAAAFSIYTASLYFRSRIVLFIFTIFAFLLAIGVGYTRIYDNRHFMSDVFVGAIVGVLCAVITVLIINRNKKDWL